MLAAVLKDFNQLVLEDVPKPNPGLGEVVVRIVSCGFCATDYKAIKGIRRNVAFPFIAGHEPAGVVAAVGPGVRHFKDGDEVICQPSGYLWRMPALPGGQHPLLPACVHAPAATGRRSFGRARSPST